MGFDLNQAQAKAKAAQDAITNAPANAQAAWANATSDAANADRVASGAQQAADLISNGYNPQSEADNIKALYVASAALSLIAPPAGPILGGGLALLLAGAQGIQDAAEALGIAPKPGCHSPGTFTPADPLALLNGVQMPPGSFAAFAVPPLCINAANAMNCKPHVDNMTLLAGLVSFWNANTIGPPTDVYVGDGNSWPGLPPVFNPPFKNAFAVAFGMPVSSLPEGIQQFIIAGGNAMMSVNQGTFIPPAATAPGDVLIPLGPAHKGSSNVGRLTFSSPRSTVLMLALEVVTFAAVIGGAGYLYMRRKR